MRIRGIVAVAVAAGVGIASIALAEPVNVPNGGFEEGNFSRWDRFERGGGDWSIYSAAPRGLPGPIVTPPPRRGRTLRS